MALMRLRKKVKIYLLLHIALLTAALMLPLYRAVAARMNELFTGCILHDRLFLYCPFCGGTRAVEALLRLDFSAAWAYNPMVVLLGILFLALDVWALVRLIKGRDSLLPLPTWAWVTLVILVIAYGVLRNYLMIAYGYDPTGDLGVFWNR